MADPPRLDPTVALALRTSLAAASDATVAALLELLREALAGRGIALEYALRPGPAAPHAPAT